MASYLVMYEGSFHDEDREIKVDDLYDPLLHFMWQNRQHPFSILEEGDTVYSIDKSTRKIRWEYRVTNLLKERYKTRIEAFQFLESAYGLKPAQCTDYIWSRPAEGWLLAFSCDIIRPLSIPLPRAANLPEAGRTKRLASAREDR